MRTEQQKDLAFKLAIIRALMGIMGILAARVGASAELLVHVRPHVDAATKILEE